MQIIILKIVNSKNTMSDLKKRNRKSKKTLESEENQQKLKDYFDEINRVRAIQKLQEERFASKIHCRADLIAFIEKLHVKYRSDAYKDRWYKKRIVPPQELYHFVSSCINRFGIKGEGWHGVKVSSEWGQGETYYTFYYLKTKKVKI